MTNKNPPAMHGTCKLSLGTMHYDDFGGPGPAILLLHGIPGCSGSWHKVAHKLESEYRVIVPDLLGFGLSVPNTEDIHAETQSDALIELMQVIGVRSAHVVGFDFGGPIAVRMYDKRSAFFRSLALLSTNAFVDTFVPLPLRLARVPGVGSLMFSLFFGRLGLSLMWFAACRARHKYPLGAHRKNFWSTQSARSTKWVFYESLRDLPGRYTSVERTLPTIRVPTAVIWSDKDPFFHLSVGKRLARAVHAATFAVVHGVGHFLPEEAADVVAAHLREHFRRAETVSLVSTEA